MSKGYLPYLIAGIGIGSVIMGFKKIYETAYNINHRLDFIEKLNNDIYTSNLQIQSNTKPYDETDWTRV